MNIIFIISKPFLSIVSSVGKCQGDKIVVREVVEAILAAVEVEEMAAEVEAVAFRLESFQYAQQEFKKNEVVAVEAPEVALPREATSEEEVEALPEGEEVPLAGLGRKSLHQ